MTVKSILSHVVAKPLFAGITAAAAEHLLMKNNDIKSCVMFGGAVGAGVFGASSVGAIVGPMLHTSTPMGALGKNLEMRVIEIACGSASAYALNHFVLKNEYNTNNLLYKLAIVAGADFVGEAVCEMLLLV